MFLHGQVVVDRSLEPYQARVLRQVWPGLLAFTSSAANAAPSEPSLEEVVARQVAELTADLAGPAPTERARPAPDLTRYADALEVAVRACVHDDLVETLFQREWQCIDCGRYFDRAGLRAAIRDRRRGYLG